jgi:hypothetical protein
MGMLKFIVSIAAILTVAFPGASQELADVASNQCDRLAASPYDTTRAMGLPGVPFERIDAPAAIEACRAALARQTDDARLTYQLARALQKDGGIEALTEAMRLYRFAADQGHLVAQYNLGAFFYETGRGGLPKSDEDAVRLYRLAANRGLALAQYRLGFFYEAGRGGLPKDDKEAARLYTLAADQGIGVAQIHLGLLYMDGRGGLSKDAQEATRLFKLAIDQGDADAQNSLGVAYAMGRGGLPKCLFEEFLNHMKHL